MTSEADEKILLEAGGFNDGGRKALLLGILQRWIMATMRI